MWGIDRLSAGELGNTRKRLRTSNVALLSQAAAVDRKGLPVLESLESLGVEPVRVFAPEHGFDGAAQAEVPVESAGAKGAAETQTQWVSLYGKDKASLSPNPEHFDGVDLLVIDLVDIGSRYYTYVWTALMAARAAHKAGVHTLVLDRPNPISGNPGVLEGTPQADGFTSFVGLESIPIRHSMTLGEILVHFFEKDGIALGHDGSLSIVSCNGWERNRMASAWGRPFIGPSPNMPSAETALVYPGGCLLEGTNLSEGRGTTTPFQSVGAPFLDGPALARSMNDARLPGVMVRPHSFQPSFEKHAGTLCEGVSLHVTQPSLFRPVTTYLTLLAQARAQAPDAFSFRTETYEFESEIPAFDLLTGSAAARIALSDGAGAEDLVDLVTPVPGEWKEAVLRAEGLANSARA